MQKMGQGSFQSLLDATLACVQQVLQLNKVGIRVQQVHTRLVIINEQVAVCLSQKETRY